MNVRKRKSVIGILTVLMMIFTMVPSIAFAESSTPADGLHIYMDKDGDGVEEEVTNTICEIGVFEKGNITVKLYEDNEVVKTWTGDGTTVQFDGSEGNPTLSQTTLVTSSVDLTKGLLNPNSATSYLNKSATVKAEYGDYVAEFTVKVVSNGFYDKEEKGGLVLYTCDADGKNEEKVESTAFEIELGETVYFKVKYGDGTEILPTDIVDQNTKYSLKTIKAEKIKVTNTNTRPCIDIEGMEKNAYNTYDAYVDTATGIIKVTGQTVSQMPGIDTLSFALYGESVQTAGKYDASRSGKFFTTLDVTVVPSTKQENEVVTVDFTNTSTAELYVTKGQLYTKVEYTTSLNEYAETDPEKLFTITSSEKDVIADGAINVTDWSKEGNKGQFYVVVDPENLNTTGETTITITANKGAANPSTKSVRVIDGQLSNKNITNEPGYEEQLTYTLYGKGMDPKNTVWKSSNESIATVDENGLVKLVGNGECEIAVTNGEYSATCKINSWADGFYVDGKRVDVIKIDSKGERVAITYEGETYYMDEHVQVDFMKSGVRVYAPFWETANSGVAKCLEEGYLYADKDATERVPGKSTRADGKIAPIANGETMMTVYDVNRVEVGQIMVVVTGCDTDAENGKWGAEKDPVSKGNGGSVQLKGYTALRDTVNEVGFSYYIDAVVGTDAEFNIVITSTGKKDGSASFTEEELANMNKATAAYQAAIQDYITVTDEEGNVVDADVTVERIHADNGYVAADVNVDPVKLDNNKTYKLKVKAMIPTVLSVYEDGTPSYGKFLSDVSYEFTTEKADEPVVPEDPTKPEDPTQPETPTDKPADPTQPTQPEKPADKTTQTGDDANMASMFALMIAALLTAGAAIVRRREN